MVKSIAVIDRLCVACGCCVKECPRAALTVVGGVRALVDAGKCIGCGKCAKACPGGLITLRGREEAS